MEDYEMTDYYCPKCGESIMTRDCEYCGGDGTVDDLFEQDPLWYEPDDWEYCDYCRGIGAYFWCANKDCNVTKKEIKIAIKEQTKEKEYYERH